MNPSREASKLKVIEGYREPGLKTFDSSTDSIDSIEVDPGTEVRVVFFLRKVQVLPVASCPELRDLRQ